MLVLAIQNKPGRYLSQISSRFGTESGLPENINVLSRDLERVLLDEERREIDAGRVFAKVENLEETRQELWGRLMQFINASGDQQVTTLGKEIETGMRQLIRDLIQLRGTQ